VSDQGQAEWCHPEPLTGLTPLRPWNDQILIFCQAHAGQREGSSAGPSSSPKNARLRNRFIVPNGWPWSNMKDLDLALAFLVKIPLSLAAKKNLIIDTDLLSERRLPLQPG